MAKTILLPQTTFTGSAYGGEYEFDIPNLLINAESITVVFDGVKYENLSVHQATSPGFERFSYGADLGNPGDPVDFSTYPFVIISIKQDDGEGGPR